MTKTSHFVAVMTKMHEKNKILALWLNVDFCHFCSHFSFSFDRLSYEKKIIESLILAFKRAIH